MTSMIVIMTLTTNINSRSVPFVGNPITENCVACKFIWENIKEALSEGGSIGGGNSFLEADNEKTRNPILAAQAFQYFCRIAPDIFYEPCNVMFEKLFFLTQDFCANKKTIEICINNGMCAK